tara:strand:+ start:383 stop:952 length:570 start_codon:yes stop_codon:yes gene_type:complete
MKSSIIIGGTSDQHGRNASDFYATPPECTIALLAEFGWLFKDKPIWEPACGNGAISKVLLSKKYEVYSSDKYNRGYGESEVDFLKQSGNSFWTESIITNPPFNLSEQFIRKAVTKKVPFAMLLKATYWHAAKRTELFNRTKPMAVIAMSWRPAMSPERGKSGTMDFCWTIWDSKPSFKTEYLVVRKEKI